MSAERLESLRDRLARYLEAERKILDSQEYLIGNGESARKNRRAELQTVRDGIKDCQDQIDRIEAATNPRTRRVFQLRPRN